MVFAPSRIHSSPLELPCGQCIGCRIERTRQWATRCMHEASLHDDKCFITLTYDDEHLPWDHSLNKQHFQAFMKRLRWKYQDKTIRFFHCGEYGDQLQRPHYHALLFNHTFLDLTLWSEREGINTYVSEELQKLWPYGFSTVGEVTWESAAYCARYATKKITGAKAKEHYWLQLTEDLKVEVQPEYATMSLKPGIGRDWYEAYKGDCYPSDFITHKGKKLRVPRYYDKLLDETAPDHLKAIKKKRRQKARLRDADTTPERLRAREYCAEQKLNRLNRPLEG